MISQQARQYYLQSLGIDSYFPRRALPGSAASPIYCDEEEFASASELELGLAEGAKSASQTKAESVGVSDRSDGENALPVKISGSVASGLAKVSIDFDVDVKPKSAKVETDRVSDQSSKAVVHQFSLAVWRLNSKLMVVDSRNPRLALPTTTLLANILSAIGFPDPLPKFDTVRWPLASDRGRNTRSSEDEARSFFQAYLQAQFEKRPSEVVLLMGAHAARYGLSSEQWSGSGENPKQEAELLGKTFNLATNQKAIVVPSLAAMLQKPELKMITWKAIKNLRQP